MLRLIFCNLRQKKMRSLLTLLGLALATGTMFSLLSFRRGYERGIKEELDQLGAQILVVPKGCPYDAASLALHGANWPCYLKESYLAQVASTPGVAVAAPVFMAASHNSQREVILGVTREYLQLRPFWKIRGRFPTAPAEVMLGAEAARRLNAAVGGEARSSLLKTNLRVAGILEPVGGPEDDFTFALLRDAQENLRHAGHLTHVLVKLSDPHRLDETVQALRGCDAGMQMNIVPLAHLFDTIRRVSAGAQYLLAGIAATAFLVGGAMLVNTMLMAVLERTNEIGVWRALGASKGQVFSLFLSECVLLGTVAALIGLSGSWAFSRFIEAWARGKIAYAPDALLVRFDFSTVMLSAAIALIVAVISGVVPAVRAARLNPAIAFRARSRY